MGWNLPEYLVSITFNKAINDEMNDLDRETEAEAERETEEGEEQDENLTPEQQRAKEMEQVKQEGDSNEHQYYKGHPIHQFNAILTSTKQKRAKMHPLLSRRVHCTTKQ